MQKNEKFKRESFIREDTRLKYTAVVVLFYGPIIYCSLNPCIAVITKYGRTESSVREPLRETLLALQNKRRERYSILL